jgi:hypothetical protein
MATQLQHRRGTTAENNSFPGAEGELTVDLEKNVLVVHNNGPHPQVNASTLLSSQAGNGASLVGIQDALDLYDATTVEAALQEVKTDLSASTGADLVGYLPAGTGASTDRSVQDKLRESVCIFDFMSAAQITSLQSGTEVDITSASLAAHAAGKPVFYPYGFYKHVGYFPACEGGIIGEGWSTDNNSKRTILRFYNCTDPQKGAITPKQSSPKSKLFRIEDIMILASSWDATTGCLGYGLDIGVPVSMIRVNIGNFKRSNIFLHHVTTAGSGFPAPYDSYFQNVVSHYSGEHGCLVGAGANVLTFINYEGKWNGAPAFGTAPTAPGNYDGFYVAGTADGNDIDTYTPQNISIMSGDCSYNARYGWNFHEMAESASVFPGYAEGNFVKQARCGQVSNCLIAFSNLIGNTAGFLNEQTYSPYFYRNTFYIGGKQVHPSNVYTLIANPTQEDELSGTIQNAPDRAMYFSRSNNGSNITYISGNTKPDGTAVDKDTETVATLRGFGTYELGIGSGSDHLRIRNNVVRLPQNYYQATAQGWDAASVLRSYASAAPVSGTYRRGDIMYNSVSSSDGYLGWTCVSAGSPGTWHPFGRIVANSTGTGASVFAASPTITGTLSANRLVVGTPVIDATATMNSVYVPEAALADIHLSIGTMGLNSGTYGVRIHEGGNTDVPSAVNSIIKMGRMGVSGRSINASGSINAAGADYAEYENNNGLVITKGSIVGFKVDGTLTLTFSESVRFGIKSTNPSYVGGDTWGTEDKVGAPPIKPTRKESDSDEEWVVIQATYEAEKLAFEEALEAVRLLVDRVAYSGKVPVNVMDAMSGDYIVAVAAANGGIHGECVPKNEMTFGLYQNAVGRVNRILEDGRAEVAVIIH